jgi:peptide/nickel transport system permease protein
MEGVNVAPARSVRALGSTVLQLVLIVFLVTLATFSITTLGPSDPATTRLNEAQAQVEARALIREELGLDRPVVVRYFDWLGDALRGDLGRSVRSHQPVIDAFRERLPVTLQLTVMAELFALVVAIPLAAWSAHRADGLFDRASSALSFGLAGMPQFILGLVLVYAVALRFEWFPVTGWVRLTEDLGGNLKHAFLPMLTLAAGELAVYVPVLRAEMQASLREDYVTAARSRGLPTRHILFREVLKPSSFGLVTLAGVNIGRLLGGAFLVEYLFALGGLGRLLTQAIRQEDYPVLQGTVLLIAVGFVVLNTIIDASYRVLDPRLRSRSV